MKEIYVGGLNSAFGLEGPEYIPEGEWEEVPNSYVNNSPEQREAARQHCYTLDNRGGKNGRAKTWQITYKDGRVVVIKALQRWAMDNGYSASGVKNLAYGKWRYYRDIQEIKLLTSEVLH